MLDRVTSSCVQIGLMMVNKCAKFQSNISIDYENIWTGTKTLTKLKLKKGHNSVKMPVRITSSCLQVVVMLVNNKCAKFQKQMSMDF